MVADAHAVRAELGGAAGSRQRRRRAGVPWGASSTSATRTATAGRCKNCHPGADRDPGCAPFPRRSTDRPTDQHHGRMGEQDNGRNHAGASEDQAAEGGPTEVGAGAAAVPDRRSRRCRGSGAGGGPRRPRRADDHERAGRHRAAGRLAVRGRALRPGRARVPSRSTRTTSSSSGSCGFSDVVVLDFRDLFLPTDRRIRVAVNCRAGRRFWLVAGMIVGWALSAVGSSPRAGRGSDRRTPPGRHPRSPG